MPQAITTSNVTSKRNDNAITLTWLCYHHIDTSHYIVYLYSRSHGINIYLSMIFFGSIVNSPEQHLVRQV